jgi:hypothetical protein
MVDADTHPSGIRCQIIDPVGHRAAGSRRTSSGLPWGRYSRPWLRKSPTSSFFFLSTEITDCCQPTPWSLGC